MNTSPKVIRRQLFVKHYLIHQNITMAYEQAGFAPDTANAYHYFQQPEIQGLIKQEVMFLYEKLDITLEKILGQLNLIAFANIADIYRHLIEQDDVFDIGQLPSSLAAPIRRVYKGKNSLRITLHTKVDALKILLNYHMKAVKHSST